jgi:hypothetical protein
MSQPHTTEELLKILADERRACMNGQRLNLAVSPSGSPFLDKFLQPEGLQRFTAYRNFRTAIHDYQRAHQVSGIVWQTFTLKGHSLSFPKIDDQLIALDRDRQTLQAAKTNLFDFWWKITAGMDFYLSLNAGKSYRLIGPADIEWIMQRTEWASLTQQGKQNTLELILQLGWGQPDEAAYRHGFPDSGSEYVHAVNPGHTPLV